MSWKKIENALSCIEHVKQSAVIHCEIRGLSQLVAYVNSEADIRESDLREKLGKIIPQYMIPTKFVFVAELPKNANGKVDRKTLKSGFIGQLVNG